MSQRCMLCMWLHTMRCLHECNACVRHASLLRLSKPQPGDVMASLTRVLSFSAPTYSRAAASPSLKARTQAAVVPAMRSRPARCVAASVSNIWSSEGLGLAQGVTWAGLNKRHSSCTAEGCLKVLYTISLPLLHYHRTVSSS